MTERRPADVEQSLAGSVAAFLRSAPKQQIPPRLRRFKGIPPKGLRPHRAELVGVLEDEILRRQILEWLDGKVPLARSDAELLRLAVERPEGWSEALGADPSSPGTQTEDAAKIARLEIALGQEQERVRRARAEAARAKEDARRAKEEAHRTVSEARSKAGELSKEVTRLAAEHSAARRESKAAAEEASRAERARERAERKERTSVAKAQAECDVAVRELRSVRREAVAALARVARLEDELQGLRDAKPKPKAKKKTTRAGQPKAPARRMPLPVPKGRFEDDPETLHGWLGTPDVVLLVDGYNVTKAEGGFGDLSLELQRDRLVERVSSLQLKTKVSATIVFDGSTMPPGMTRPRKRRVKVVYSKEGETADDRIIALLQELSPHPVVLTTNDKELQGRARELGATVATSSQLLALLR